MNFLKGYRTYIIAIVGVIFNGLVSMGYIDESLRGTVNGILTFLGLGTIRNAIK